MLQHTNKSQTKQNETSQLRMIQQGQQNHRTINFHSSENNPSNRAYKKTRQVYSCKTMHQTISDIETPQISYMKHYSNKR